MRYLDGTKHLTLAEAAKLLGVPRAHLVQAIRTGKLRAHWHRYRLYLPEIEVERYQKALVTRSADRIAAHLLHAMGARVRVLFTWKNGHGRE